MESLYLLEVETWKVYVLIINRPEKDSKYGFKLNWFVTDQLGLEDVVVGLLLLAFLAFSYKMALVNCDESTKSKMSASYQPVLNGTIWRVVASWSLRNLLQIHTRPLDDEKRQPGRAATSI